MKLRALALLALALLISFPAPARADAYPGGSGRTTWVYSNSGQAGTTNFNATFNSSAARGFRLAEVCWVISSATAVAATSFFITRTSTAQSGGSAIVMNNTAAASVGSMVNVDPADPAFMGVMLYNATPGTSAGLIDQWSVTVPAVASQASVQGCRNYGMNGEKQPRILPGVANGLVFTSGTAGAGALATTSVRITLIGD